MRAPLFTKSSVRLPRKSIGRGDGGNAMLTKELAIAGYENGRVVPDRLNRRSHAHYAGYAERMLHVYRSGIGRTRQELHRAVGAIFAAEADCPLRRIHAFCQLTA